LLTFFFRQTDTVSVGHFLSLPLKLLYNILSVVVVYNHDLIKVIVVVVVNFTEQLSFFSKCDRLNCIIINDCFINAEYKPTAWTKMIEHRVMFL